MIAFIIPQIYTTHIFSKEDEEFSLQSFQYIRESAQINKPLGVGYGFKLQRFSINERFSKLQGCRQSRPPNQKLIFPPFGNGFLPSSKNIILKDHPIQNDICYYNHRCLMSSGLIFDYIIMNIFSKKLLESH